MDRLLAIAKMLPQWTANCGMLGRCPTRGEGPVRKGCFMPFYQYHCPENGKTLEVMHGLSAHISTWGELCEAADEKPGNTPPETPVEKVIGQVGVKPGTRDTFTPASGRSDGHTCGPGCCH